MVKISHFTIHGRLAGLNEYTDAINANRHKGNNLKQDQEDIIGWAIKQARLQPILAPVRILYKWYEPNRKRDKDNIAAGGHKFINDALQKQGILANDGWKNITGFSDEFYHDKDNPRVEVYFYKEE